METPSHTTYRQLRASIAAENARKVKAHQAAIAAKARMRTAMNVAPNNTLNLIAQGDGWFDYPLPIPVVDQSDVIAHLKRLPDLSPEVLSLAHYGEAAEDMIGLEKLRELTTQLGDHSNGKFDAILFSGGGNDIVGNQLRLWLVDASAAGADPAKGLNDARVEAIFSVITAGYQDLFAARDDIDATIPIFAHSYDLAIPSGQSVACVGPWLKPSLDDRGWTDPAAARAIVRQLLVEFATLLDGFAADPRNNFIHITTQGTLIDSQWANELHPTPEGFAAITGKFVLALRSRFPGRI